MGFGFDMTQRAHSSSHGRQTDLDVAVVLICRNMENLVERQLAAIASQEVPVPFSVVLVNDGSDDASGRVLDRWANQHDGWTVVHRARAGGTGSARNSGLKETTRQGILFVDSDDVMGQSYVSSMGAALENADVVFAGNEYNRLNSPRALKRCPVPLSNKSLYFAGNNWHVPGGVLGVSRRCLEEVGLFNEGLPALSDVEWCWRASASGFNPVFVSSAVMSAGIVFGSRAEFRRAFRQGRDLGRMNGAWPTTIAALGNPLAELRADARRALRIWDAKSRSRVAWTLGSLTGQVVGRAARM